MNLRAFLLSSSLLLSLAACDSSTPSGSGGAGTGGGTGTGGSGGVAAKPSKPFVLVHGAWMGAWAWDDVAAAMRAKGASVTTVELPAHGADMTGVSGATLDAYVAKVRGAVEGAGEPVVLVGHSMGGVVITQLAESVPDKIADLVYLAAYVPKDGQQLLDLAGMDADSHVGPALQIDMNAGVAKIALDKLQDIFCADCTTDQAADLAAHYRDEPLAPFATPVHVTAGGWGKVTKRYVYTKQDNAVSYALQQAMTAGVTLAGTATLDTSHSPFLSHATEVADTLLGFDP